MAINVSLKNTMIATSIQTPAITFCRYCLSNTNEYKISEFLSDERDEYEIMVKETFNVKMCRLDFGNKMICLKCIEALTNAAKLKKQFIEVQTIMLEHRESCSLLGTTSKEEACSDDEKYDIDDRGGCHSADESQVLNADDGNSGGQDDDCNAPDESHKNLTQKKNNTLKLITNSNMCLFKSKKIKYCCYTCKDAFIDIKKLRDHSQIHATKNRIRSCVLRNQGQTYINVDISDLICKKCSSPCHDIEELWQHLKNIHNETFEGTEHLLVPFKLEKDFRCVICQKEFTNLFSLLKHMNIHSNRNVCEICGVAFTLRTSLRSHLNNQHKEKKCSKCKAVFPTLAAIVKHMRRIHNLQPPSYKKRYCNLCDMTFTNQYILKQHKIEKHGVKPVDGGVCNYCKKEFVSIYYVNAHIRSVHLKERNYPCSKCDMAFATSADRKRHEISHGDERAFSCDFCHVKFRSSQSMKRHSIRKHWNTKLIGVSGNCDHGVIEASQTNVARLRPKNSLIVT